jgi:hypothetical protein
MDNFLDELQLTLIETESIHQTLSPLCSRFTVACQESYQERPFEPIFSSQLDRSQPVSHSMESGIDNVSATESRIADAEKKLAVRCLQLQNEYDALNAKLLEAEKKLQTLEVQAKLDKEASDSAKRALIEQIEVHRMAAEEADAKLAKATLTGSSTPASGSPASFGPQNHLTVTMFVLCSCIRINPNYHYVELKAF